MSKIPQIVSTITKHRIDIVHVHMAERGSVFREGFVVLLAKALGAKTIIHMHGADIETWYDHQPFVIKRFTRMIFCSADRMIVLGKNWLPFMQQVMHGHEDKIRVLHNAVHVEDQNMANPDATDVVFYGMLIKRKGVEDLMRAFAMVKDEIPERIQLRLYGDDLNFDPEEKIAEYHLEGRASYGGWLTEETRKQAFANTLVNVLPSYNEGLPMTILESMGYGIPNISTNIAAIPEVIDDGENGYLIKPGDVDVLAERIRIICNDREAWKRMSFNAYHKAKEEFSLENHFEQLISTYNNLIEEIA